MKTDELTGLIISAAMKVHSRLGPGLLELAYEACLTYELQQRGCKIERQKTLPVVYDGVLIDCGYRIDLLVNDEIVVELKAVETVMPIHHAQLLSYLRLSGKQIGLLINFNVLHLRDGITRKINSPQPPRPSAASAVNFGEYDES